MIEEMKSFPDSRMTASIICNMKTSYMDDRYFDCLPITTKMFSSDGISDAAASAAKVCRYYAEACEEGPQHAACSKNYIADEYQRNPNAPYPGTQIKKVYSGSTLLVELIYSGHVDMVEAVIKRGANVNESMGGNWTPLTEARSHGTQAMIEMLMRNGAK
jgi:hypothetical protein